MHIHALCQMRMPDKYIIMNQDTPIIAKEACVLSVFCYNVDYEKNNDVYSWYIPRWASFFKWPSVQMKAGRACRNK